MDHVEIVGLVQCRCSSDPAIMVLLWVPSIPGAGYTKDPKRDHHFDTHPCTCMAGKPAAAAPSASPSGCLHEEDPKAPGLLSRGFWLVPLG